MLFTNGRFPSIFSRQRKRPFPPNTFSFRKTYNSLWRCTPIIFVLPNGRSPSNPYTIPNNFHNQPAGQKSKPLSQSGRFVEILSLFCRAGWGQNGRFPSHHFCYPNRPFPLNISSFRQTYNSLWCFTSITFVLPDGRFPSNPYAISNNFNNQSAA
ncbi:MAG: hypothetical protein R6X34_21890 [Chloroflexota bacterium]